MKTLYRASRVHTLTHPATGEWLLVDGRHVQRAGSGDPPQADRVVELPGATIVPGFIDTHVHLTPTGVALANADVEASTSCAELLRIARDRCAGADGVVLLQGFDETRWDRPHLPSIAELEDVAGAAQLVIMRADGHVAWANHAAIAVSQVGKEPGAERDERGEPTGRLTQAAVERMSRWVSSTLSDLQIQAYQLQAAGLAAAHGVTAVHEMQMPSSGGLRDLQVFLGHRTRLPVDATPIVATMDLALAIDHGFPSVGGDLPVDGSVGARTAALLQAYRDGPGEGILYHDDDRLAEFFHGGHAAGLQVGVHAIGDRAIEQVLRIWERVYQALDSRQRRHFRARRHRIEHVEMVSEAQVERAAILGLAMSVQPTFDRFWGHRDGLYETGLGPERAATMNPLRTMMNRGLEVGIGSDAPVTPLDPLLSVRSMEAHHDPAQRLSRLEAIRLHTTGSARLAHQEEKKGALGPGMHADLVAYDVDPFEAGPLDGVEPILTVSLGREVFAS